MRRLMFLACKEACDPGPPLLLSERRREGEEVHKSIPKLTRHLHSAETNF